MIFEIIRRHRGRFIILKIIMHHIYNRIIKYIDCTYSVGPIIFLDNK